MKEPVQLRLTKVHALTQAEAVEQICRAAAGDAPFLVVTPNLSHLSRMQREPEFRRQYDQADLALPDGWPVVRLVRLHGATEAVRVAGSELVAPLCAEAARRGLAVGFVGGAADAAAKAADVVRRDNPGLRVTLVDPATRGFDSDDEALRRWVLGLPDEWPEILFLGLGEPRERRVALRLREDPRARVIIAVGKAIEFTAGTAQRAPEWFVSHNLEWLHRAITEPRRLGPRYLQGLVDLGPMYVRERRAARRAR
ncbi:MAG: WecB/TagA/CpsF family glycosyltransferase [Actinomycetota bacterium]|nr:WecB/TagA/CpsF family glycosyltransferase [Actinomycetota bacterium]